MRSASSLISLHPSPHPAPLPLSSSSSLTCCPELDLSVTLSPAPKTGHTNTKPHLLKMTQHNGQSPQKPRPRGQTRRKENTQVCYEDPVVVTVTPEPCIALNRDTLPRQPIRSQARRGHHHGASRHYPAAESSRDQGCLERVELNTTQALRTELQSLQGAEFNSQKAIKETLQRSERTKNLINTRATEVVNVSRSQLLYTSLVSVEVREDELISQFLQERLLLVPSSRCHGNKATDGPSLLLFRTSDLLRQKTLPTEEEPVNDKPRPCACPINSTFDLFRRQSRWEATP